MKKAKPKIILVCILAVVNISLVVLLKIVMNKLEVDTNDKLNVENKETEVIDSIDNKSIEISNTTNDETETIDKAKNESSKYSQIENDDIDEENVQENKKITNEKKAIELNIDSKTTNKTAIFFGDSIVAGFLTKGYSWPEFFNENGCFRTVENNGISDYRVSKYDDPNKWLVSEFEESKEFQYDYVILEGGVNDMIYDTPLGEMSSSENIEDFDVKTFAGGLETYIATAKANWPDAKIGYIISYSVPKYEERGLSFSYDDYQNYVSIQKRILDKWEIPYLDLSVDEYSTLLEVETNNYLPDYLHPNKEGYQLISPYIYKWIAEEV